ncbi:cell envelope integrity protein TolA [beta proteobacterium MWH-UniP1]
MLAIEARESRNAAGAALLMHGLLAAGLLVSLNWTRQPNTPVQAELWSGLPRQIPATPTPAVTKPAPTPPKPTPVEPTKADISVQKKKAEAAKEDLEKKREQQKEAEKKEAAKKAAEKKLAEQRAAEKLEAQRKAELARLGLDPNAKANAKGKDIATKAGVVGGAELGSKTGIDADYEALIQARIKARINYPDRSPGNPEAIVAVEQLPTGEITRVRLIKPSGTPTWDAAVQRAVWAANPLPKKKDGTVARVLELSFRPKENP